VKTKKIHRKNWKTYPENELYFQIMKKRRQIKDLLLRNLLKTNLQLLKNLDVSNSVLF
jgi:hypothetical protein